MVWITLIMYGINSIIPIDVKIFPIGSLQALHFGVKIVPIMNVIARIAMMEKKM